MKKSERLELELEEASVYNAKVTDLLLLLCKLVEEGDAKAREIARDVIDDAKNNVFLDSLKVVGNTVQMSTHGWPVMLMAWSLGKLLTKEAGTYWNNVETYFNTDRELAGSPRLVVTVQNVDGKTPGEQKRDAELERDEAYRAVEHILMAWKSVDFVGIAPRNTGAFFAAIAEARELMVKKGRKV